MPEVGQVGVVAGDLSGSPVGLAVTDQVEIHDPLRYRRASDGSYRVWGAYDWLLCPVKL
jgi:hypothetical protein